MTAFWGKGSNLYVSLCQSHMEAVTGYIRGDVGGQLVAAVVS